MSSFRPEHFGKFQVSMAAYQQRHEDSSGSRLPDRPPRRHLGPGIGGSIGKVLERAPDGGTDFSWGVEVRRVVDRDS